MNIRLGAFTSVNDFMVFVDPLTGIKYRGQAAMTKMAEYNALVREEQAQERLKAEAYKKAVIDAQRADWDAGQEAAAAQGKDDYAFSQWHPEATQGKSLQSSILPLAAAAAAALFFWKG